MRPLIVSIGNPFMRDDGIGQAILIELKDRGVDADLIDLGTDMLRLSLYGEGYCDIVVLDSLRGAGLAGEVLSFSGEGIVRSLDSRMRSAHRMGSIEALEVLRSFKQSLKGARFHFVGIVADDISIGEGLTEDVKRAVPVAADIVCGLLFDISDAQG
ncbi:MAG: hydrogenase maturation protease [Candidatus Thermoplasmatota archaeon]|nr:hydrogenase maturation protease [Candidatus Thermoplasmatota archaeon]